MTFNGIADEAAKDKQGNKPKKGTNNMFASFMALYNEEDRRKLDDLPSLLRKMGSRSLKDVLEDRFEVTYAQGCDIIREDDSGFAEAVRAAKESDAVILALGGNCGWVNVTGGEGKDRSSLGLPGV